MKIRNTILVITVLLFLSSCVVKSLHPFYTKETISFDKRFIGEWQDSKKGKWKVVSYSEEMKKDNLFAKKVKETLQLTNEHSQSYFVERAHKDKTVWFLVTPFKVKNQRFLDFLPINIQENTDNLLNSHSIYTHSLVKYDIQKNGEIEIRWLDEDKIEDLFKQKKIKIKHEKIGALQDKYLLTAQPKELQKFIEKYMASNDDNKWKTKTKFTLSKINATD